MTESIPDDGASEASAVPSRERLRLPLGWWVAGVVLTAAGGISIGLATVAFGPVPPWQPALDALRVAMALLGVLSLMIGVSALRPSQGGYLLASVLSWPTQLIALFPILALQLDPHLPGGSLTVAGLGLVVFAATRAMLGAMRVARVQGALCPRRLAIARGERAWWMPGSWALTLLVPSPLHDRGEQTSAGEGEGSEPEVSPPPAHGGSALDWVESITVALIMALMIRSFALEAFKIPTGSMLPTLSGETLAGRSSKGRVGDKIIVDKSAYVYGDPERFDIFVFKYPLNSARNFIKRVVGMPGEELWVYEGDLWRRPAPGGVPDRDAPWELVRKPDAVQAQMWVPFYAMTHASPQVHQPRAGAPFGGGRGGLDREWLVGIRPLGLHMPPLPTERYVPRSDWAHVGANPGQIGMTSARAGRGSMQWPRVVDADQRGEAALGWRLADDGGSFVAVPPADSEEGAGHAIGFVPNVTDRYALPRDLEAYLAYDPSSRNALITPDQKRVGDLRVESTVTLDEAGSRIRVWIVRGQERVSVEVGVDGGSARVFSRGQDDHALAGEDATRPLWGPGGAGAGSLVSVGVPFRLDASYADRVVRVAIDGVPVLRWEVPATDETPNELRRPRIKQEMDGPASVALEVIGGPLRVRELTVYRDIHYRSVGGLNSRTPTLVVGPETYIAMGDNAPNSKDSRLWYTLDIEVVDAETGQTRSVSIEPDPAEGGLGSADGGGVHWTPLRLFRGGEVTTSQFDQARLDEIVEHVRDRYRPGELVRVTDVTGIVQTIEPARIESLTMRFTPGVPRSYVIGRALLRFWPEDIGFVR